MPSGALMPRFALSLPVFAACILLAHAGTAFASNFDVSPIMLELSQDAASGTIVVTNRSPEVMRLQVTAFAWGQRADGEMTLAATKDVVFFPAMLSLKP